MGQMTDTLQQLGKSIQNQNSNKILKKDCKENFEIYLFPIIWNKFAKDSNLKKTYEYFKNPNIIAQYIMLTEIKEDDGKIQKTIYFNELTLNDKTKIYNNILELIYKQFKFQYDEKEKKQKELQKINLLIEKEKRKNEELKEKHTKLLRKNINGAINGAVIGSIIAIKKHKNKFGIKK